MMGADTLEFICPILNDEKSKEIGYIKSGGSGLEDGCDNCPYAIRVDYDVEDNKPCVKFSMDRSILTNDTFVR